MLFYLNLNPALHLPSYKGEKREKLTQQKFFKSTDREKKPQTVDCIFLNNRGETFGTPFAFIEITTTKFLNFLISS